jgi:FMN phosphatase YigB (HAD superfamily)
MMDVDALLFDFGGTLDTDGVHWCEKFWDLYRAAQVSVDRAAFDQAYLAAERELGRRAPLQHVGLAALLEMQVGLQMSALAALRPGFKRLPAQEARICAQANEDVEATLVRARSLIEHLRYRYRIGVVSNFYGNLEEVLRDLRLAPWIAVAVDSARVGVSKPDPRIFALALEGLGVPAARCLVIGDAYDRDVVPAKSLGCRTVWLKGRSFREWTDVPAADAVIGSIHELPGLLRGGAGEASGDEVLPIPGRTD